MMVSTIKELELMSQTLATIQDQRLFLMTVSVDAYTVMDAAVRGTYDSAFFGYVAVKATVNDNVSIKALLFIIELAVIHRLGSLCRLERSS
jgi:hypothetical protein